MEDLETLINEDSFYAVYFVVLEKIRIQYSKINGIIDLPIMKIEKLYSTFFMCAYSSTLSQGTLKPAP